MPAVSLSYTHVTDSIDWLDYVIPYVEYSSVIKDESDFNDSELFIMGLALARNGWYIYNDLAFSNGNEFVGGDTAFGDRLGANADNDWITRFNINFGYACVVDPEESADTAIIQAVRVANDYQADITFASVIRTARSWPGIHRSKEEFNEGFDALAEKKRSAVEDRVAAIAPSMEASVEIYSGIGFIQIIKRVLNNHHDLVVKCAEDTDWIDRLFGSEDMHLLRKCPCPVLMLKPDQREAFRNILATVDVNDDFDELDERRVQAKLNRQVLAYSAALCMPELREMHVGSAWEAYAEDFYLFPICLKMRLIFMLSRFAVNARITWKFSLEKWTTCLAKTRCSICSPEPI